MKKEVRTGYITLFTRASFIAAPIFLLLYGIAHWADGFDGNYGPGPAWTIGHIMFLLALLTFVPVIGGLRQQLGSTNAGNRFVAVPAEIIALLGLAIFIRVPIIDIFTGLSAPDHAAMGAISSKLNSYPLASLAPFYNIGPLLFQLGLLGLMLQLAILKPGRLPWWSPVLLLLGFLLLGYNLNFLILGAVLIGIAFMPLLWRSPGV